MQEEWKQIDGYDNYEVSNLGNVRNKKTKRVLKQSTTKTGYKQTCLCNTDGKKMAQSHRLVALAFIDNKSNLPCVDHIDRNKENNTVTNLRWCNKSQNQANRFHSTNKSGYKGVHWHVASKKWVAQTRVNRKVLHIGCFDSAIDAAKAYNKAAFKHHGEFALLNDLTPLVKL